MTPKLLPFAALLFLAGCDQGNPTLKTRLAAKEADSLGRIGRFRIVNGMPSMMKSVMLLDTQTGKSWVLCNAKDSAATTDSGWCAMRFYGSETAP